MNFLVMSWHGESLMAFTYQKSDKKKFYVVEDDFEGLVKGGGRGES